MWEGSWEDDAQVWDAENNTAYDPTKIHRIDYEGKFHKLSATQQTHPSPQRVPVLFQAGASKPGIKLAGGHAEGLYCGNMNWENTARYVKNIRESAKSQGRDPNSVKAFTGMSLFLGKTLEEAEAKRDAAWKNVDPIAGLAKFSGYSGIDFAKFPLDEPFDFKAGNKNDNAIHGLVQNFESGDGKTEVWTPRKLGAKMAFGGLYPQAVGTAEMVADFMEDLVEKTDVDGMFLRLQNHDNLITTNANTN